MLSLRIFLRPVGNTVQMFINPTVEAILTEGSLLVHDSDLRLTTGGAARPSEFSYKNCRPSIIFRMRSIDINVLFQSLMKFEFELASAIFVLISQSTDRLPRCAGSHFKAAFDIR